MISAGMLRAQDPWAATLVEEVEVYDPCADHWMPLPADYATVGREGCVCVLAPRAPRGVLGCVPGHGPSELLVLGGIGVPEDVRAAPNGQVAHTALRHISV